MAIPKKLLKFINSAKVKYEPVEHRKVFTAYDKAATLKAPQKIIGKTLVAKLDPEGKPLASYGAGKTPALVLIPANKNLDIQKFKKVTGAKKIDFIKEAWMKKNLKGVKIGAIPPLGNLWGFPTFADKTLLKEPKIIINAGDYNWSIKISSAVLKKLIPDLVIGSFSQTRK
jgi:prolyl-tRNA editing enzyme YbaK/EbsC (Cys-tRNA(Pro) deacylase)